MELTRWASPACGLVFFALFGFAEEAQKHYALFLRATSARVWRVLARIGIRRPMTGVSTSPPSTSGGSKGFEYTMPPAKISSSLKPLDISLPAYSPAGTGSLTSASFDTEEGASLLRCCIRLDCHRTRAKNLGKTSRKVVSSALSTRLLAAQHGT